MKTSNQNIVDRYFEAYAKHDINAIREVMDENVTWYFLGDHPLAGVKKGVDEVIAFYDAVGKIMGKSKPEVNKLIVAEKDNYLIECVHTKTTREDGINLDHHACVLWTFANGKIVEGRHFFSDQQAVNKYFTALAGK